MRDDAQQKQHTQQVDKQLVKDKSDNSIKNQEKTRQEY
jgi:hypothetical protein